jgi:two-component system cell cycle sensor histidine kinase/response regulator CckA
MQPDQSAGQFVEQLRRWLLEPAASIQDIAIRHKSRLLAIFLLLMMAIFAGVDITRSIMVPGNAVPWYGYVFLGTAYILNRTGYYKLAAILTSSMFPLVIFSQVLRHTANTPILSFNYLILGLMLGSILLSGRGVAILAGVNIGGILLMPILVPEVIPGFNQILTPLATNAIGATLALVFIYHRNQIEQARQVELRQGEERLRLALNAAHMGTWDWHIPTNVVTWSEKMEPIFGLQQNEFGGTYQAFLDLVWPEDRALVEEAISHTLGGERQEYEVDFRVAWPDGSLHWLAAQGQAFRDDTGQPIRMAGTLRDITQRKHVEDALRRSEEKYRLVVEHSLQGIAIFQHNRIVFVNPAMCNIMGYTEAELIAFSPEQILATVYPEERATAIKRARSRLQNQPESPHQEYRVVRKDGTFRWLETYTTTMIYEGEPGLLSISIDVTERKQAEEALRASEERYQSLFENTPIPVSEQDFSAVKAYIEELRRQGVNDFRAYFESHPEAAPHCARMVKIMNLNKSSLELYQAGSKAELMQDLSRLFDRKSYEAFKEIIMAIAQGKTRFEQETVNYTLTGEQKNLALSWSVMPGYEENCSKVIVSLVDMTQHNRLEEQLRQAQKMEAIGRLAGGIAHDFNNLLTVIKGYTGLLLESLDTQHSLRKDVEQIEKAAERAASLTRQLLAFSRKQVLQIEVLDLNSIVANMDKMLRRLIGEDIDLITILHPFLERVQADPGQIEQVIMNLAVNARDAMPHGGKLTIETTNIEWDEGYTRHHIDVTPGRYAMLAISDTGSGMDPETQSHLFEPFFTTKEQGKGTGLGLATVHGIVNQSGGHIQVYSEPNQGTTFKIYLPAIKTTPELVNQQRQESVAPWQGSETILLVEDEDAVRELTLQILLDAGYTVLEASHGEEAIQVAQKYGGTIHLLLTDVVMPGGVSGPQLVAHLASQQKNIKFLYMSGYADDAVIHHGRLEPGTHFLQKPFSSNTLVRKLREVLDHG